MTKTRPTIDTKCYLLIKLVSYAIRYLICYFTIEAVPIFENETAQEIWNALFGGIIYTIFWGICYPLVGFISKEKNIKSSSAKSILYFFLYLPLILMAYIVLQSLTRFGVLPITFSLKEIAFNCIVWCTERVQEIAVIIWNLIVNIINNIAQGA